MKKIIPVFFASDDNYAPFIAVALESILENSSKDYFYKFYVLTTGINEKYRTVIEEYNCNYCSIEFVDLNQTLKDVKEKFAIRDYYSLATYYRFFIADMFPQYEKALYLDCDIAVLGDISEMFNVDIKDYYVGAIQDESLYKFPEFTEYVENALGIPAKNYFNAGIMLINLEAFRRQCILSKFMDLMKRYSFKVAQDQDYLNVLCKNNVRYLEVGWNKGAVLTPGFDESTLKIVHYNLNRKPWHQQDVYYGKYFWKYADRTSFKNSIHQMLLDWSEEDKRKDEECLMNLLDMCKKEARDPNNYFNKFVKRGDLWKNLRKDLRSFVKSMSMSVVNGGQGMLRMTQKLFR